VVQTIACCQGNRVFDSVVVLKTLRLSRLLVFFSLFFTATSSSTCKTLLSAAVRLIVSAIQPLYPCGPWPGLTSKTCRELSGLPPPRFIPLPEIASFSTVIYGLCLSAFPDSFFSSPSFSLKPLVTPIGDVRICFLSAAPWHGRT